jgi:hypothetical protein
MAGARPTRTTGLHGAKSLTTFAQQIRTVPKHMEVAEVAAITKSSMMIKEAVQDNLPSSKIMRNVGKRGMKVGVKYKVARAAGNPFSIVSAYGPVHILEWGASPRGGLGKPTHRIPKLMVGRGKNSRVNTKKLYIPGIGVRAFVMHPGFKGQYPWQRGVDKVLPTVAVTMQSHVYDALFKSFRL